MVINAMNIARYIPAPGLPLISTPHSHHNSTTPVSLSLPAPHCPTELQPVLTLLSSIPSFQALAHSYSSAILTLFAAQMRPEHLNISDYLFHTGDKSDEIFIIKQGKFSLLQAFSTQQPTGSPRKVLRRRIEVAVIGAGACLGEQEALEGRLRVYSCVCRTEIGVVWVIEKLVRSLSELFKSREKGERRQFGG
jgi:hypothetical protein